MSSTSNVGDIVANEYPSCEIEFEAIAIDQQIWHSCLQDKGCSIEDMPAKKYRASQIQSIGPKVKPVYYYHLACTAIYLIKIVYTENTMGRGWKRIPQKKINAKMKITKLLIAMRKQDTDGVRRLDQNRVLTNISGTWG